MNLDDMTLRQIKQAAQLAEKLGLCGEQQQAPVAAVRENPYAPLVGHYVVVRSNHAGVLFGKIDRLLNDDGFVLAPGWRKAFYWTQAGACEGLSITGPGGGKITPAHHAEMAVTASAQVLQVLMCSDVAVGAWESVEAWDGRS